MGLITRIRGMIGGGPVEEEMAYECQSCRAQFPTPHAACPSCGSTRVEAIE